MVGYLNKGRSLQNLKAAFNLTRGKAYIQNVLDMPGFHFMWFSI